MTLSPQERAFRRANSMISLLFAAKNAGLHLKLMLCLGGGRNQVLSPPEGAVEVSLPSVTSLGAGFELRCVFFYTRPPKHSV